MGRGAGSELCLLACLLVQLVRSHHQHQHHPSRLPSHLSAQREGQAGQASLSRGLVRNLASPVRTVLSAKPRFPRISAQLCSSDAFSARLWPIEAPVRRKPQTKFPDRGSSVLRLPLNQSHP